MFAIDEACTHAFVKIVLIPLGLTAAALTADVGIHKNLIVILAQK